MAKELFSRYTVDLIHVVPRKFGASMNEGTSKESDPRETQIVCIHENVLHEKVRTARVLNLKENCFKLTCERNSYRIVNIVLR